MANYEVPSEKDRRDLPEEVIAERISSLEVGDLVIFNDKMVPLKVKSLGETVNNVTGVKVQTGNHGKDGRKVYYVLSHDGDYYRKDLGVYRRSIDWIMNLSKNKG